MDYTVDSLKETLIRVSNRYDIYDKNFFDNYKLHETYSTIKHFMACLFSMSFNFSIDKTLIYNDIDVKAMMQAYNDMNKHGHFMYKDIT